MKEHAPLKRHPALVSFSKEHHFGLLLTWKIRRGFSLGVNPDRISKYIIHFFNVDLKAHFADEELFLFSRLPGNDSLRLQAEAEHKEINRLVGEITTNRNEVPLLKNFAELLEKHIRFEERKLFNHLQHHIPASELAVIAERTGRSADPDTNWTDVFWLPRT